jgi:hypothetical protein
MKVPSDLGAIVSRRRCIARLVAASWALPASVRVGASATDWRELEGYFANTIGRPAAERAKAAQEAIKNHEAAVKGGGGGTTTMLLAVAAAALGTMARMASPAESLSQRYGSRSKLLLIELRKQRPDSAWPKILEGVWHYEVVRRGGVVGAALLQASVESGDQLLRAASEQMPSSPAAPFAHAIAMLSIDPVGLREPARKLIELAIERAEGAVQGPLVNTIGAHARALKDVDAGGDASALQRSALTIM